jgi:subtilisin family serine protease
MRLQSTSRRNPVDVGNVRRGLLAGIVVGLALAACSAAGAWGRAEPSAGQLVPGELLVKFRAGTSPSQRLRTLAQAGAVRTGSVARLDLEIAAVLPGREPEALSAIRLDPHVEYAEQDVVYSVAATTPSDPFWPTELGLSEISSPQAWDLTRGASGLAVAVLDSGVDFTHPDLVGAAVPGFDFVNGDTNANDDNGHGTAVAGLIAARGQDGGGMAGMCWQCSIMPVKVVDVLGNGTSATLAAGLVWATDRGARVINMSLAGSTGSDTLAAAVRYAADRGVVLVASAGNQASTQPTYPAAYPGVISVAAGTPARTFYAFSNRGDWVQVAAPGCNTAPSLLGAFVAFCGTSSSAPLVSGIAALALSLRAGVTSTLVTRAIEESAVPLAEPGVRYGRVDAYAALLLAINAALGPVAGSGEPAPAAQPSPPADPNTGQAGSSSPKAVAPAAARRPSIAGVLLIGRLLRAGVGTWTGSTPILFHYRWLRCRFRTGGCRPIAHAVGPRYRVVRRDRGLRIRVVVTAVNTAGATARTSLPTRPVRRR